MNKYDLLIKNASKYIGTKTGTTNGDKLVAKWLSNFNLPLKDRNGNYTPYCAAFVMNCLMETAPNNVFESSVVLDMWHNTPSFMRSSKPSTGYIFFWDFGNGTGHAGFVTKPLNDNQMLTIEGNTTNPAVSSNDSERNGGWVINRERTSTVGMIGKIRLLGFIDPFKM